ncbi:uncharacterized protein LOC134060154 [Sardina pilchardus]|uniref:uncharacterized protein LOC134060154 n=1 Tax=Sardina pilchardus TaxID=27697 RepID=UPI002E160E17
MEESQPSPSSQKEVLIIPLHPNTSPIQQTSSPSSPQTKTSASASASSPQAKTSATKSSLKTKTSASAASLKKTSNATVSSSRGPAVKALSGGEGRGNVTTAVAVEKSAEEIKQVHIIEESQKEVLIIPLHPNATPLSPIQQTSSSSSPQTSDTASSLKTTSSATASSPRGPAGSQLFAELLESHARRNPRKASLEPAATPPGEATPSSVTTPSPVDTPQSPTPPTTSNGTESSPARSQLFAELLESHARRNPRKASLEPAATPPGEDTPSSMTTPSPVDTPQSPTPPTTSNGTESSPARSQLFAELLESHARRNPRKASLEPSATPPGEATPSSGTTPSPVDTPRSLSLSMTPPTTSPQPSPTAPGGIGLSNPQLLKELKQPPPLKHVNAHKGLTTVFSGRGKGLGAIHMPQP